MTICIAACLFLWRTGSLSVNRDVGSATPTTGAAWPNILTHANAKSRPTVRMFFMGAILRQPKSRCQVGRLLLPPRSGSSPIQDGSASIRAIEELAADDYADSNSKICPAGRIDLAVWHRRTRTRRKRVNDLAR